ncbi:MAG: methylated-DNA--[protein]-cysteine S-methyltransferase [Candidatus Eisenbacteria bacterium]|nr:methylated-DNA--[protein]-cysteine S-methyltransferase [Candidatus Eisenbacteria bacterium]
MILQTAKVRTPIGVVVLHASEAGLCGLDFEDTGQRTLEWLERRFGACAAREARDPAGAGTALAAYFDGEVSALDAVVVDMGGTPFQRRVWETLRIIPAGKTWSYSDLAHAVGAPRAVRAVGAANARNPVSLMVPCHRVIAADGTLGGYGGGLERKRWLLAHEAAANGSALPLAMAQTAAL